MEDSYPFFKLWSQRVLSKNVKLDPLEAEQEGRFDHGEGLVQTIPTGHHSQVHDLPCPRALGHRPGHVTKHTEGKKKNRDEKSTQLLTEEEKKRKKCTRYELNTDGTEYLFTCIN